MRWENGIISNAAAPRRRARGGEARATSPVQALSGGATPHIDSHVARAVRRTKTRRDESRGGYTYRTAQTRESETFRSQVVVRLTYVLPAC